MKASLFFDSPVGKLWLSEDNGAVTGLSFRPLPQTSLGETSLLRQARLQLDAYFNGSLQQFDLPLAPTGTMFQRACWHALQQIPYGETRAYADIAALIGNPKACRAVGMANNKNPISIIIPCHRVIGADGSLVGYGGGLDIKRALLALEKMHKTK